MADKKLSTQQPAVTQKNHDRQQDEVDEVLSTLRRLYQKVTSPIIKSCLEAARTDIAFLADSGATSDQDGELEDLDEELEDLDEESAAA